MRKVCEVYLVSSASSDERGVELTFPVSRYEMMDAFEQIHTKSPGDVYWQVDEFYCFDYLAPHLDESILCSTTSGGADHNNSAVEASFYGVTYSEDVPDEFRTHIADMQTAFNLLDSAVAEANATMTDGNRLDPIQVKAIFYALCFGESAPSQRAADRFVDCFFITEQRTRIVVTELEDGSTAEREEVYTATVPLSLAAAYENLAAKLGRAVTDEDKENAAHIYTMIAGNANGSDGTGASGGTIQIDYGYGSGSTELDTSGFTNPVGKNADDLVQYAIHAYQEHWGYVWGTFGHVLTESLFEAKLAQYPDALAGNADFIRQTWVGGRTTDCVGLIKGYCMQREHMPLNQLCQEILQEQDAPTQEMQL